MSDTRVDEPLKNAKQEGRGKFFAIDRRTWAEVCSLGLNEAVTYLVLASGTSRNNRLTRWSKKSLRNYAGIAWQRGDLAVQRLIEHGALAYASKHSKMRPSYELSKWEDVHVKAEERRHQAFQARFDALEESHKSLIAAVKANQDFWPKGRKDHDHCRMLCEKGFLRWENASRLRVVEFQFKPIGTKNEPDWIYLPNAIVTGTIAIFDRL